MLKYTIQSITNMIMIDYLFSGLSAGGIFVENVRLQIGRLELSKMADAIYIKKHYNTPGSVYRQFHVACKLWSMR